jgi:thioredoxin 1
METMISNVVYLTTEEFRNKVFDYTVNKEWKYSGELPAIIDFYADWCGPCKMVAPILQDIAKDYQGKIIVYKVDTESERELAAAFGISSIPTLLFVPMTGQPRAAMGALPRQSFDTAIKDVLFRE